MIEANPIRSSMLDALLSMSKLLIQKAMELEKLNDKVIKDTLSFPTSDKKDSIPKEIKISKLDEIRMNMSIIENTEKTLTEFI